MLGFAWSTELGDDKPASIICGPPKQSSALQCFGSLGSVRHCPRSLQRLVGLGVQVVVYRRSFFSHGRTKISEVMTVCSMSDLSLSYPHKDSIGPKVPSERAAPGPTRGVSRPCCTLRLAILQAVGRAVVMGDACAPQHAKTRLKTISGSVQSVSAKGCRRASTSGNGPMCPSG